MSLQRSVSISSLFSLLSLLLFSLNNDHGFDSNNLLLESFSSAPSVPVVRPSAFAASSALPSLSFGSFFFLGRRHFFRQHHLRIMGRQNCMSPVLESGWSAVMDVSLSAAYALSARHPSSMRTPASLSASSAACSAASSSNGLKNGCAVSVCVSPVAASVPRWYVM